MTGDVEFALIDRLRAPTSPINLASAPAPPDPAEVSFVVIAFNEAGNIENCLQSILAQSAGPVREVIVVDDASTDGTAELVRQVGDDWPAVTLVRLAANGGRGNARAVGVSRAQGDFVAMVDGDIVLPPHWLESCLAAMEGVSAVGGKAVPDGDVAYLFRAFGLRPRGRRSTMTITGNNGLYRRDVFEMVGFDPDLAEGEDIALNHAMVRAGLKTSLVPELTVAHRESKTLAQSLRWLYQSGKGGARQLETYHQVRLPDVAFAGQVLTLAAGMAGAVGRRRPQPLAVALAWMAAVAIGHMLACFRVSRHDAGRFALATAVDAALIASYDAGRVVGRLSRRRRP